jgi:dTDP-4-amino-4,6-dideoxygalactose transaminase
MSALFPRHRIDIEPDALARALIHCAREPRHAARELEAWVCPGGEVLATLSVRSGFDALLTALALPYGSEVLLTGWTIPDMIRLVRAHGLVPVPLDCEAATLAPTVETLVRAITARSRVLVVAQLFGAAVAMDALAAVARRAGMLVIDDDAQGFTGRARLDGTACADVVFHSFGTIKTATALGGGLMRVRDAALRTRVGAVMDRWPVQPSGRYARKLATYLALALPREPRRYRRFERALAASGRDVDTVLTGLTRGFPADTPEALQQAVRLRPCEPLCATLLARLSAGSEARVARRREAGERMIARLGASQRVLGSEMPTRTHWLFAIRVRAPDALVGVLRREGFDAARGTTTITAVPAAVERPGEGASQCASWLKEVVFLPVYPEIPEAERDRLAEVIRRERGGPPGV